MTVENIEEAVARAEDEWKKAKKYASDTRAKAATAFRRMEDAAAAGNVEECSAQKDEFDRQAGKLSPIYDRLKRALEGVVSAYKLKVKKNDFQKKERISDEEHVANLKAITEKFVSGKFTETEREIFNGASKETVEKFSHAINQITRPAKAKSGSYCESDTLNVFIGRSEWSNHKETYFHEAGHAVLSKYDKAEWEKKNNGDESAKPILDRIYLAPYGLELLEILKKDVDEIFDRFCGAKLHVYKRGVEIETDKRDYSQFNVSMLVEYVTGTNAKYSSLHIDARKALGVITDTMQAATKNKVYTGPGHKKSYYNKYQEMRIHEPFANVSAMLSLMRSDPMMLKSFMLFPRFGKIMAEKFYGMDVSDVFDQ